MVLRDCMLYAGIRSSRKFARLNWFQRDFFYGLLHAAWPAGRFEADVTVLRAALYAPLLSKVPQRDVQDALVACHEVGLVKLWTDESGRGWGEVVNYRQHGLKKRQQVEHSASKPTGDPPAPDLFTTEPPATPPPPPIQIERKKELLRAPRDTHTHESQQAWIKRLQTEYPHLDINAELRAAKKYCERKGGRINRNFVERFWLSNEGETIDFETAQPTTPAGLMEPEPEGWKVYLRDTYTPDHPDASFAEDASTYTWPTMPPAWRKRITREMRERGWRMTG